MGKKNVILAALICIAGIGLCSVSVEAAKTPTVSFADMNGSSEDMAGGTISPELTYEKEGDILHFNFDTAGYQERYYTATAFKNTKLNLETFGGVSFHVQNKLETPLRMNFAFFGEEGRTVNAGAGFYVKLQGKQTSYAKVEYGCFELPAGFDGDVEIPFDVLAFQDDGERAGELETIWGYGIICVAQQNEAYEVDFSEIRLLAPEETVSASAACELEIEGDERAFRPKVGESDTPYHCIIYNMMGEGETADAVFSFNDTYENAAISESGVLTIGSGYVGDTIEIKAETPEGLTAVRQIQIYDSWTNSISTDNGFDASIADPSEIAPIVVWADEMQDPDTLLMIRGAFVLGGFLFMAYYLIVRRKNRSEK